jgi:hypothetical protein
MKRVSTADEESDQIYAVFRLASADGTMVSANRINSPREGSSRRFPLTFIREKSVGRIFEASAIANCLLKNRPQHTDALFTTEGA